MNTYPALLLTAVIPFTPVFSRPPMRFSGIPHNPKPTQNKKKKIDYLTSVWKNRECSEVWELKIFSEKLLSQLNKSTFPEKLALQYWNLPLTRHFPVWRKLFTHQCGLLGKCSRVMALCMYVLNPVPIIPPSISTHSTFLSLLHIP